MVAVGHMPSNLGASFRFSGCVPGGNTIGSGVGITALYIPEDRIEFRLDTTINLQTEGVKRIVLLRRIVPGRDARRDKSAMTFRIDGFGRSGLGALSIRPRSSNTRSSSSSNNVDSRKGDGARGGMEKLGGAKVDTNSSLSETNLAIRFSNAFDSDSTSEEKSETGAIAGIEGVSYEEVDEVGRNSSVILVICSVLMTSPLVVGDRGDSSFIVSWVDETSFAKSALAFDDNAVLPPLACNIAGSFPSSPAMKKKSANAGGIV